MVIALLVGFGQDRYQQPPPHREIHRFIQQNVLSVIMSMNTAPRHKSNLAKLPGNSRSFSVDHKRRKRGTGIRGEML